MSGLTESQRAKALAEFTMYFVENYPGPSTIISNPNWHAPKIFNAAKHAILDGLEAELAAQPQAAPPASAREFAEQVVRIATGYNAATPLTLGYHETTDVLAKLIAARDALRDA